MYIDIYNPKTKVQNWLWSHKTSAQSHEHPSSNFRNVYLTNDAKSWLNHRSIGNIRKCRLTPIIIVVVAFSGSENVLTKTKVSS